MSRHFGRDSVMCQDICGRSVLAESNDGIFICRLELCASEREPNQEVRDGVKVQARYLAVIAVVDELLVVVSDQLQVTRRSDAREPENWAGVCVHGNPLCGR